MKTIFVQPELEKIHSLEMTNNIYFNKLVKELKSVKLVDR